MYYIVHLTYDEVSSGIMFKIQDYLISQSDASIKRVKDGARGLTEKEILVSYDNGQARLDWDDNISNIAYMNELTHQLLLSGGIISSSSTIEQLPDNLVGTLRLPYYS